MVNVVEKGQSSNGVRESLFAMYLTIIPRVRMGYESIAHEAEWAIDSVAMRARGIIFLVKSSELVKKISRLNIFRKLKLDINPFLQYNQSERSIVDRSLVGFY